MTEPATENTGRALRFRTARQYLAKDRPPLEPLLANDTSTLLARGTFLVVAGPSGIAKSLAVLQVLGYLAGDGGSWLTMNAAGGHRVLLVTLEGSDDDTADRVAQLVPLAAIDADRFFIADHWSTSHTPNWRHLAELAAFIKTHEVDVVAIDTLAAFFAGRYDIALGVPEIAFQDLERLRALSGRNLAIIGVSHTRKRDTRANTLDEIEEISGGIAKKADSALVMRRDGDSTHRRRIYFAKTRRGPQPSAVVAQLPRDSSEPPMLRVVSTLEPSPREGTEAERIAEWITANDKPQGPSIITAALSISERTLARRRPDLELLGITYGRVRGRGNAHAYGTTAQWTATHGDQLATNPAPGNPAHAGNSHAGLEHSSQSQSQPGNPATRHDSLPSTENGSSKPQIGNPATRHPVGVSPDLTANPEHDDIEEAAA